MLPITTFSADIFKTDKLFNSQQYDLAKQGYLEASRIGNPHAYYQLGVMHSKGLGVKPDQLNALIYFSLAAEYKFHDSEQVVQKMLSKVPEENKRTISDILLEFREKNGKLKIATKFFPILNNANLDKKFTFNGENKLESKYYSEDGFSEGLNAGYEGGTFSNEDEDEESFYTPISTPRKPYLIIDHDVATDGSKRNITEVQKIGSALTLLDEYALFPLPVPTFDGKAVEFIHRSYMGSAAYNKFKLADVAPNLYGNIIRTVKKLKSSSAISDRFQYMMALQNFPWLKQDVGEVENGLLELSKQGHSGAMFEYGLKLYREQTEIEQAIHWISEASKYGLARAEYRLGKLLTSSPWVKYDERKALFWFNSAVEKDHIAATLKAIELRLTATDKNLHDVESAIRLLDKIEAKQRNNPEYFYLLALSHKDRKNRDFTQVIEYLEKAIFMGQTKNWDTNEWQDLLSKLTQGRVTIVE